MISENERLEIDEDNNYIKKELEKINVKIDSIYDLVNRPAPKLGYVPLLIEILDSDIIKNRRVLEGIIRAITVKEAKGIANDILFKIYYHISNEEDSFKWVIGNAIETLFIENDVDSIFQIVLDKSNARSRQMFVMALGKTKTRKDEAENVLINLLDDKEVQGHAIFALGKLKSQKAKEKIETFLTDPNSWLRREAKAAIKKIG